MIHMKLEHKLDQYFAIFEPNERVTIVGEKEEHKRHRQNTTIPSIIICNPYTNQNHKQHG